LGNFGAVACARSRGGGARAARDRRRGAEKTCSQGPGGRRRRPPWARYRRRAVMTAIAVTIARSDSGGGAGVQADLKTFSALRVYGAAVIAALTAQNTKGVIGIHDVPADFVTAQIDAVFSDLAVNAVKIGMLARAPVIKAVADGLARWGGDAVVLDPVMVATSGDRLLAPDAVDVLKRLLI